MMRSLRNLLLLCSLIAAVCITPGSTLAADPQGDRILVTLHYDAVDNMHGDAIERIRLTMTDVDPKQATFVKSLQCCLMKSPRVGTIGAPPAAVRHGGLKRWWNPVGQKLPGR